MGLQSETEADYTDRDDIVNPQKVLKTDFSKTGNGLAYTAVYYWLLVKRKEMSPGEAERRLRVIARKCSASSDFGLYNRSPDKIGDQNGFDDYVCLAAASNACEGVLAEYIWAYATAHGWCFNNVNPGKTTLKSWFGRSPSFRAHVYFSTKRKPSCLIMLGRDLQMMFPSNDATAIVLSYMMADAANEKPNGAGMKEALAKWLNNADHPIVKYWVNG